MAAAAADGAQAAAAADARPRFTDRKPRAPRADTAGDATTNPPSSSRWMARQPPPSLAGLAASPPPPSSPPSPPSPKLRLVPDPSNPRPADVGAWLHVDIPSHLPEAGPEAVEARGPYSGAARGGCPPLSSALASCGGRVLYRASMAALVDRVRGGGAGAEAGATQLLVTGPPRSGKSVALASTVASARAAGWTVVYVPAPATLLTGGAYAWNEGAGGWDTPVPARALLASLVAAHSSALSSLRLPDGRSAAEAAAVVLEPGSGEGGKGGGKGGSDPGDDVTAAVDAAVSILDALRSPASTTPVLFAIDGYDALAGPSRYNERGRGRAIVNVPASDLRLARALRVLDRAPAPGVVDVAALSSLSSKSVRVPAPAAAVVGVPRFDSSEWSSLVSGWAAAAAARGAPPPLTPGKEAVAAFYLTGGAPGDVGGLRAAVL